MSPLTDAEELGVHAVEVGDEDKGEGPCGIKEEQEASREVEHQAPTVHHQPAGQLLGHHQPGHGALLHSSTVLSLILPPPQPYPTISLTFLLLSVTFLNPNPTLCTLPHAIPILTPAHQLPSLPHHPPSPCPSNLLNLILQPHNLALPITIPSQPRIHPHPLPYHPPHPHCAPFLSPHPLQPLLILTLDPSIPLHPHQTPSPSSSSPQTTLIPSPPPHCPPPHPLAPSPP